MVLRHFTTIAATTFVCFGLLSGCTSSPEDFDQTAGADDSMTTETSAFDGNVKVGESLETTADLNLRTGPSTSHSVITVIPDSHKVTVVGTKHTNGWYNVKYDGHTGWSSGLYLKTVSSGGGGGSSGGGSSTAVSRAMEWVNAKMPYCGGTEGGHDYICGGTCERHGAADHAGWNSYRSDCSGLVSFAWDLPAPGRITSEFAPYNGAVSYVINASGLEPGDALNSDPDEHIILFAGWSDKSAGLAHIIEEYNCGHVATYHTLHLKLEGTKVYISDWDPHTYTAIRHR